MDGAICIFPPPQVNRRVAASIPPAAPAPFPHRWQVL
jgi:hypothetical protein